MKAKQTVRREVITVEDRRAVLMVAKARKPGDVAKVNHETFIRRELKSRLGWPQNEPASAAVKQVAADMAAQLSKQALVALATRVAAEQAAKAKQAAEQA